MIARAATTLSAVALLAGCGDDLESRQQAMQGLEPARDEITIRNATPQESEATVTRRAPEDNADQGAAVDVPPESLIDTAQGFSADPMDDATGFDPTPDNTGGFAPESMAPESFEE